IVLRQQPNQGGLTVAVEILTTVMACVKDDGAAAQVQDKRGKRGPVPDNTRHNQIANTVRPYGKQWRMGKHLETIANQLDKDEVRKPNSKNLRHGTKTWTRALETCRSVVIKDIEYSLKRAPHTE